MNNNCTEKTMDEAITAAGLPPAFPDYTQLPDEDGTFVKNFQEHPQSIILTDAIGPVVERLHPDGQYAIGQDCGIYWRETDPPVRTGNLEIYHLIDFVYRRMEPNERGHYPIPVLDVELGLWQGSYQNQELLWLRWWDSQGNLLLTGSEQVEIERPRVEQERERAKQAERKVTQLAERLRAMGIDPDAED